MLHCTYLKARSVTGDTFPGADYKKNSKLLVLLNSIMQETAHIGPFILVKTIGEGSTGKLLIFATNLTIQ